MNLRRTKEALMYHQRWCLENKQVALRFPKLTEKIKFKNYNHSMRVPFVIYADFESYLQRVYSCEPSPDRSFTNAKQHHRPMGFKYKIVSLLDEEHEEFIYIAKNSDEVENIGLVFVREVEKEVRKLYEKHKFKKPMKITDEEEQQHKAVTQCHICEKELGDDKVRDHCHLTDKYRGAAHNKCNLEYRIPKHYPIFFHNLSGYDAHLFIKSLGADEGEINCIPNNEENYISFSKKILVDEYLHKDKNYELKQHILDHIEYSINPRLSNWNEKAKRYIDEVVKYLQGVSNENKHFKFWSVLREVIQKGKSWASQKEEVEKLQQAISDGKLERSEFLLNAIEAMPGEKELEESEEFWSDLEDD